MSQNLFGEIDRSCRIQTLRALLLRRSLVLTTLLFSRLHYESFVSLFESQVVKGNTVHIQFSGMLFQKFRESSALLPSAAYYSYKSDKIQLTTTGFYFCSTACSHCTQYTVHHIIVFNWFSQAGSQNRSATYCLLILCFNAELKKILLLLLK